MTTDTSPLPFAPLTIAALSDLHTEWQSKAANALSYAARYHAYGSKRWHAHVKDAIEAAHTADHYLDVACQRIDGQKVAR